MADNKDTAKLNEYNLGCLCGLEYAKKGMMLEDILPKVGTVERANGIKAGFAKYLSEAAADDDESMNPENGEGDVDMAPPMPEGGAPEGEEGPDVGGAVDEFNEQPTFDSFYKVFKALGRRKVVDSSWLKCAAFFFVHAKQKIKDDVYLQVANGQQTIEYWLNRLLADEFNAWYQYYIVEKFLLGEERPHIQEAFKANADDELNDHAAKLLQRIHDLGYSTSWLTAPTSWDEYASAKYINPNISIDAALNAMMESENTAIAAYTEAVNFAAQVGDVVSRDIFKANLADEQEHLATLRHFVQDKLVK